MIGGDDLREPLRPRFVCFVTTGAEHGGIGKNRLYCWVFRMFRQRAMAGFAVDVGVLTSLFLIKHIYVAGFAGIVPGVNDRQGSDICD